MKNFPIGIQSFEKIVEEKLLYIDKTRVIYKMINTSPYNFLSRPRRFGKSLLLSTIKALFQGKKELFTNLWIENKWNWEEKHPVVHISFSSIGYKEIGLAEALNKELDKIAQNFGIEYTREGISQKFKELLEKLSKTAQVVLLIDEYDKPLIDYLDKENIHIAKAHQQILKAFYSIIKDSDPYIRFLLITGVSKFSKVSVFSDLNNLRDITLDRHLAAICGYTQEELLHYFEPYAQEVMEYNDCSKEDLYAKIKEWYNGYSWDGKTRMYNPFSILNFYAAGQFHNFWFSTGTPTFLVRLLRERNFVEIEEMEVDMSVFESYDLDNLETRSLLFQTGYVTILDIDKEFGIYTLGYPNKEVRESLLRHLIGTFRYDSPSITTPIVVRLRKAFLTANYPQIISIINSLFKSIPSQIFLAKKEAYYHSIVYLVFQYLGQFIEAEVNTSDGRIDAVVHTPKRIYLLEFKIDKSAAQAIAQIQEKGYGEKFRNENKELVAVGINFNSEKKQVEDWEKVIL